MTEEMACGIISIIGLSSLEAIAIKSIIHQTSDVKIDFSLSLDFSREEREAVAGYIVSPEIFVLNSDFFIPRRQKTVIVCQGKQRGNALGHKNVIYSDSDETEIISILSPLSARFEEKEKDNTELSQREIEVLKLVAAGKLNKEIADQLCISVNTVITHRKNISSKLGVKSASAMTTYALMNGLI